MTLQEEHKLWVDREYPGQTPEIPALGMLEEAGELLHAALKLEQLRIWGDDGRYSRTKLEAAIQDAIGDCVIYAVSFCNALGWDFNDNLKATLIAPSDDFDLLCFAKGLVKAAAEISPPYMEAQLLGYLNSIHCICSHLRLNLYDVVHATWKQVKERRRVNKRPKVVCLCGSTRFYAEYQWHNYCETMAGNIVLSVGHYPNALREAYGEGVGCTPEQKIALDVLHKRKIDLADEVLVICPGDYIGDSTRSEIEHAERIGKLVRYSRESAPKPPAATGDAGW